MYRTLGTGTLTLEAGEEQVKALILHAIPEVGRDGRRSAVKFT
ncbi:MAG: hypothetical protein AB1511_01335 [Deinococcota bacterium]